MSVFVGPPTTRRSLPGTKGGDGFDQAVTFELAEHILCVLRRPDPRIGDLLNARGDSLSVDTDLVQHEVIGRLGLDVPLPEVSGREVLQVAGNDDPRADQDESGFDPNEDEQEPTSGDDTADAAETLSLALCVASSEGIGIGIAELMRITGVSRPTLYRYLAQHAQAGSAVQVGWGRGALLAVICSIRNHSPGRPDHGGRS